ncbi:hypothetical protein TWF694_004656 [Orbilia ellipsospora]|uniref:Ankyrin repeat protein n=1 Tax=Orbilia ellipsospora TaxID=2528407 RepID=A0AAV9WVR7_9PEZI
MSPPSPTLAKCWLDILPNEIHLEILSNLTCWQDQFSCIHAYTLWQDILQEPYYLAQRFQLDQPSFPAVHEIFRRESDRVLVITTSSNGQVSSVTIDSLGDSTGNDSALLNTELIGSGILDDPVFYKAAIPRRPAAYFDEEDDEEVRVEGVSIAFSQHSPQTGDYVCSGWEQWLFTHRPETENMSIRDLVKISANPPLRERTSISDEKITIRLKMTAAIQNRYALFGGWIDAGPLVSDQQLLTSTNTSIPCASPGNETNFVQLHWAARLGNTVLLNQLIRVGRNIEHLWVRVDSSTDRSLATPLLWAAIEGQINCMTALLDAGADINARNGWARTPLHVAARFGHLAAVKLLVERGADKEARRDTHETPLHFAVEEDHYDVVKYLLDAGANKQARGMRGTPLDFAKQLGRSKIAKLLKSYGAS